VDFASHHQALLLSLDLCPGCGSKERRSHTGCIDYRLLKKITLSDSVSLPGIEDNLARLSGSSVFNGVDGAGVYHCVGVNKANRPKRPSPHLLACGCSKDFRLA
jgi:hypothetical protein